MYLNLKEDSLLRMKIKVPFTDKNDFEIDRYGENLTIKVKGPTGYIINVIPLPVVTIGMKLTHSKLIEDELYVFFEKGY